MPKNRFSPPFQIALGAIALSAFTLPLQATSITTEFGNGADTFVQVNADTTNYGTEVRARVRSSGSSLRKTYLRFDLSGYPPSGIGITAGSLELTIQETLLAADLADPLSLELWGINDLATGDKLSDWSETGLTWANSLTNVQNDGTGSGMGTDATSLGTIDVSGGVTVGNTLVFDSVNFLTFLQNDTNDLVSFAVTYTEDEGTSFGIATKENTTLAAPRLVIIPEPSMVSLMAGVFSLMFFKSRRRRV